ncbi:alpha/beta hydrolase [Gordonia sp. HY002]|uniref:alpha/beta fold hydrolase n=1 Tax=Gordonia zhenghanii TaxID=2911516 RepID=UPI001EF0FCBC|nr:alpha/beta hydrolase [Gordonia zhenghanii]MCF8570385.1 alpha/beta hydrolase [Gordonia zhenghanii]MCF8604615.1 alpha/beta hydrolase [Gordonia zhenghanii]
MRHVIGDIDVEYTMAGATGTDAVPVVFIHGLAEDRRSWSSILPSMADDRLYAYDLRGHGGTTVGDADGTLAQLGGDLIGFLEQVSGPAVVVGFSLGGAVALWAAAHRRDLMSKVIVLGTSSIVGRGAADFYATRIAQARDTSSTEFRAGMRDDTAAAIITATDRIDEITQIRLDAVGDGRGYVNAARAMASLRLEPLTPALADIALHVDVVGAAADAFCPVKAAQIILDALGDSTYYEVPAAGHLMNVDNPTAVTSVLQTILFGKD